MRLGREELLSLPQYMALCPTGQCNASCEFCSVTIHRTGIVKRELPMEHLQRFLAPVARTVRMYGIEGNGEPTLYSGFDELVTTLSAGGATFYLITNAARLTPERIRLLVARGVDSVNVSLNAASAETHRQVMKFRTWPEVLANIRALVAARIDGAPRVSVSMVVDHDNVHEVVEFLRLAEELRVDRAYLRPLSEIATDAGPVEDLRQLVPFESEVRDALERVHDWLQQHPPQVDVRFVPETFRAYRRDPVDALLSPRGFEGRWLAPRAAGWSVGRELRCDWRDEGVTVEAEPAPVGDGVEAPQGARELRSLPVRGSTSRALRLMLRITELVGELHVAFERPDGAADDGAPSPRRVFARTVSAGSGSTAEPFDVECAIDPAWGSELQLVITAGPQRTRAVLDFERLWTQPPVGDGSFRLPPARQWEAPTPDATIAWTGSRVSIEYSGPPGPYLAKSFSVPCRTQSVVQLPLRVAVREGRLGLGLLDRSAQRWVQTFEFGAGEVDRCLEVDSGSNDRLQLVLYSAAVERLHAEVSFRDGLARDAARLAVDALVSPPGDPSAASSTGTLESAAPLATSPTVAAASRANPPRSRSTWQRLRRTFHGRERFVCQKPWTDLNNFSVDGRMDVCCIATGTSQARYQLGNLLTQSFQDVWNGPQAREFRRTVHSREPLPPCRRCPLLYAFQGPGFSPSATWSHVRSFFRPNLPWRPVRAVFIVIGMSLYAPLHWILFRGFRRD
ncbi:MAG: radical SAM protein [Planctomycetota bacterium]